MTPSSRPSHRGFSSSNVTEGRRISIDQSRPFSTVSTCLASVGGRTSDSDAILLAYTFLVAGIRVLIGQHIALNRLEPHEVRAFFCRNYISVTNTDVASLVVALRTTVRPPSRPIVYSRGDEVRLLQPELTSRSHSRHHLHSDQRSSDRTGGYRQRHICL